MRIRIRIGNADTDPQSSWIWIQYGSGSTTLYTRFTKTLDYFWASALLHWWSRKKLKVIVKATASHTWNYYRTWRPNCIEKSFNLPVWMNNHIGFDHCSINIAPHNDSHLYMRSVLFPLIEACQYLSSIFDLIRKTDSNLLLFGRQTLILICPKDRFQSSIFSGRQIPISFCLEDRL